MLVIRLQRVGKKKQASFRVVLQEHTWKPQGKAKELLGFYNPHSKEKKFQEERVRYWLEKGAQPSPTTYNLFIDAGLITGKKKKAWTPKKKKAAEQEAAPAAEKVNESAETAPEDTAPEVPGEGETEEAQTEPDTETTPGEQAAQELEEESGAPEPEQTPS